MYGEHSFTYTASVQGIAMSYLNYAVDWYSASRVDEDAHARFEVEYDGQRLEYLSAPQKRVATYGGQTHEQWVARSTVFGVAGLADQMVKAGWPDGDVHIAHCWQQCLQFYMGEKAAPFDHRLIHFLPIPGSPFERRYTCSMGTVAQLARWHAMPHIDHNYWNQALQRAPTYRDVQAMRKWLSGDADAKLDFVHEWTGWASSSPASGPACPQIAKRELDPVPEGNVRPNTRKARHYYVDLLNEAAEVSFYLRWRGCQEPMAKTIEWARWPQGINQ